MFTQQGLLTPPPNVNLLAAVGRIQGAMFVPAKTPQESWVVIQYTDPAGKLQQMNAPFLDAMYLLNLLKGVQMQSGYKMPDDMKQSRKSYSELLGFTQTLLKLAKSVQQPKSFWSLSAPSRKSRLK